MVKIINYSKFSSRLKSYFYFFNPSLIAYIPSMHNEFLLREKKIILINYYIN